MAENCIHEMILEGKISESTPAAVVDVCGYRRYSLLGRFEGPAGADFKMEINNNGLLVKQEFLSLNDAGWLNFNAQYVVYGPSIGVVIYHPPANLDVKLSLYAGL